MELIPTLYLNILALSNVLFLIINLLRYSLIQVLIQNTSSGRSKKYKSPVSHGDATHGLRSVVDGTAETMGSDRRSRVSGMTNPVDGYRNASSRRYHPRRTYYRMPTVTGIEINF